MFKNEGDRKNYDVQLLLSDGRSLEGTLMLPMSSDIKRALGGDSPDAGIHALRRSGINDCQGGNC